MMGHHTRSESLFYYFRLEDHVPENHLLRLIDAHVDFGFVRDKVNQLYSDTGRPSIDPELLLRILLIGYLYGIKGHGSAEFVNWLWEQGVAPHVPLIDRQKQTKNVFTNDDFIPVPTQNAYRCPEGKLLSYVGQDRRSQQHIYRFTEKQCRSCPEKDKCTSARVKKIGVSWYEDARRRARSLVETPEFLRSRRARSKVEALFSELKQRIGLSRLRLRRIRHASEQFLLAATAQNLKRLVRFLSATPPKPTAATA